jgi:predicted acetyltransferase
VREIRPVTEAELPAYFGQLGRVFGGETPPAEEIAASSAEVELDRTLGVFEDGELVATMGVHSLALTVPGGRRVPMAGLAGASVLTTHRRQGLLRAMMTRQLANAHERGEPVAGLFTSEGGIYGRFGFGAATLEGVLRLRRDEAAFARPVRLDGLRFADPARSVDLAVEIVERSVAAQPGAFARSALWLRLQMEDPAWLRRGRGELTFVLRTEGDGFAAYRRRLPPGSFLGATLEVVDLHALGPEAYAALWRHCLDVDMVSEVSAGRRSPDEPLRHLLVDPRAMQCTLADGLWLRPIDVEAALRERGCAAERPLTLRVEDDLCPWNTGVYAIDGGGVRRSTGDGDLVLDAAALGACYLGGCRLTTLVRAGAVEERTPGAAARGDAVFTSPITPWSPYHF